MWLWLIVTILEKVFYSSIMPQQRQAVMKGRQCDSWQHRIQILVAEALIPPALYPASSVSPLHIPTRIEIWCHTFHLKIRAKKKKKKKTNFIAPPTTSPLSYILFKKVVFDHWLQFYPLSSLYVLIMLPLVHSEDYMQHILYDEGE